MTAASLNKQFGIPGTLTFDEDRGLIRLRITSPQTQATMYLQGSHITDWQPTGHNPVIFISRDSPFAPGQPFRGGIPIVFPWFAGDRKRDRIDGHPGPSHGFARVQDWTVVSATRSPEGLALKLTLGPTDMSRSMGYDQFLLTMDILFGPALDLQLTVANLGAAPISFEEAFHAYFRVVDIHEATVTGLEPTPYIDKTDKNTLKPAAGAPISFTAPTDRIYQDTSAPCTIHDGAQSREIHLVKTNSRNTVVWNPGKPVADIGEWDWHEMLCVEIANIDPNARTVEPDRNFCMAAHVTVKSLKR